jgi:hypothetical protein
MFPQHIDPAESNVMAEAIGSTTLSFLGDEVIDSLTVRYYPSEARGIVWLTLVDPTFEGQLHAISSFSDVRECYEDESELELRFGAPDEAGFVESRAQVFARTA